MKPRCDACGTPNAIDADYCQECGIKFTNNNDEMKKPLFPWRDNKGHFRPIPKKDKDNPYILGNGYAYSWVGILSVIGIIIGVLLII